MSRIWLVPSFEEFRGLGLDRLPSEPLEGLAARRLGSEWFVVSGIGSASGLVTAMLGARSLARQVILIGIAGALDDSGLQIGEVVQVQQDVLVDLGYLNGQARRNLDSMGLPFLQTAETRFGCRFSCREVDPHLPSKAFATVSLVTQSAQQIHQLRSDFKVVGESMEGAHVGLASELTGLSFGQVRAISNFLGPRDPASWQIQKALNNLRTWLFGILPNLESALEKNHGR